jgi:anti-sigma regulatory factor (Ser/Thr protein kinase)
MSVSETRIERTLPLPAHPASASKARRALREVLADCGRQDWADAAELALSELVTNVVLHAHTPLELRISCGTELRVEVADECPAWPTQRGYGEQATTGRGMGLVAALTQGHGVMQDSHGGKAVWFVLSDDGEAAGLAPSSSRPSGQQADGTCTSHGWVPSGRRDREVPGGRTGRT